ncbi:cytochrome c biogenesis protein transmembrane region, partial [Candidatus Omnitrophus magneticus]
MENISAYLNNLNFFTYLIVFAAGVVTSFTPCVYPLLPIITGVIGSSKEISRLKSFFLSLSYVLGMSITFSILGVFAAIS